MTKAELNASPGMTGKLVVITGGASPAGRASAAAFAEAGALPVIVDIDRAAVAAAVGALRREGVVAHGYDGDLTDRHDLAEVLMAIEENFGPYGVVVNHVTPGVRLPSPFLAGPNRVDVNRETLLNCVEAPARQWFAAGRRGVVINVAPAPSTVTGSGGDHDDTHKAVSAITRLTNRRWARLGVTVNALTPEHAKRGAGESGGAVKTLVTIADTLKGLAAAVVEMTSWDGGGRPRPHLI